MKKIPIRMCIACREGKNKKELLRIVKDKDGNIFLDFTGKRQGRGAYICDSKDCIKKCCKNRLLNKAFGSEISPTIYEEIIKTYDEQHKD